MSLSSIWITLTDVPRLVRNVTAVSPQKAQAWVSQVPKRRGEGQAGGARWFYKVSHLCCKTSVFYIAWKKEMTTCLQWSFPLPWLANIWKPNFMSLSTKPFLAVSSPRWRLWVPAALSAYCWWLHDTGLYSRCVPCPIAVSSMRSGAGSSPFGFGDLGEVA